MRAAALDPRTTALLVIDVQKGFEELAATGLPRNNPEAEARIVATVEVTQAGWRLPESSDLTTLTA